jgi:hypothetical protein
MYLTASLYEAGGYDHSSQEEKNRFRSILDAAGLDLTGLEEATGLYLKPNVAYWRKANQIHSWFVREVQRGTDDCGNYYVDRDKLTELVDICKQIAATFVWAEKGTPEHAALTEYDWQERSLVSMDTKLAASLLEPQSGFFFGSTEYGNWYAEDITNTISMLEKVLANESLKRADFEYHSSW